MFSLDLGVTESAGTIAPIVGGYIATVMAIPSRFMFATSAVLVLIAIAVVSIAYKPAPVQQTQARTVDSWREYVRVDKRILPLAIVVALDAAAWRISFPFWALYIFKEMNATQEQLGIALAISAGIPALTGLTLGEEARQGRQKAIPSLERMELNRSIPAATVDLAT